MIERYLSKSEIEDIIDKYGCGRGVINVEVRIKDKVEIFVNGEFYKDMDIPPVSVHGMDMDSMNCQAFPRCGRVCHAGGAVRDGGSTRHCV